METVTFRFYEELNEFLKPEFRKLSFSLPFTPNRTVKDWIESLGVPHTEVDLIVVNGESEKPEYIVQSGDYISIYPVFESFDISGISKISSSPLRRVKFIADVHLGKLARYLRMLGFDTLYRNDFDDDTILKLALKENRIILTMDRGLLKRREITHGYCILSQNPREQLLNVVQRFDLWNLVKPLSRCMLCNGDVVSIDKKLIDHLLEPKTRQFFDQFYRCSVCGKIYWQGSHVERMRKMFGKLMNKKTG